MQPQIGDFVLGEGFGGKIVQIIKWTVRIPGQPDENKIEYTVEMPCKLYVRTETLKSWAKLSLESL